MVICLSNCLSNCRSVYICNQFAVVPCLFLNFQISEDDQPHRLDPPLDHHHTVCNLVDRHYVAAQCSGSVVNVTGCQSAGRGRSHPVSDVVDTVEFY